MIRKSGENRQFRLFGWRAVTLGAGDAFHLVPRAVALCTTGLENYTVALGAGKWITSVTMTVFYVFLYLCVEAALPRQRQWRFNRRCLSAGGCSDCFVHDAAKPMAERRCTDFVGNLSQHSFCAFGAVDYCVVLSER